MIQIRNGVFESNSSSTHSICISKEPIDYNKCTYVDFYLGEFGWQFDKVDTADYLYTAIMCYPEKKRKYYMNRLTDILKEHGIRYTFEQPEWYSYAWDDEPRLSNGYIDHDMELDNFVDIVLSDEDLLMRYLFGDSIVYTGNDNEAEEGDMCYVANEYGWREDENGNWDRVFLGYNDHPGYNPEKYQYFYKGN